MKRDLAKFSNGIFDILVIGGGISGLCIAYEAVQRGFKVGLVEKNDFGAATSSATSKLIHGGLRYLKQFDFGVVRESLRERRKLMEMAPHLVYPFPFMIPTYKKGNTKWLLQLGLTMYDMLSYDRNRVRFASKKMPAHKFISAEEVLQIEPSVKKEGLTGGIIYYDAQMPDPNRLTLSFARSAAEMGVVLANYAELVDFEIENLGKRKKIKSARIKDQETGKEFSVHAKLIINAAGPWADAILFKTHGSTTKSLVRSKGIHIIVKPLVKKYAVALRTRGGRHFFIIPWRGYSLIGTTDVEYDGSPDSLTVTEKDIAEFLSEINDAFGQEPITRQDVLHSYAGLRPLVDSDTKVSSYKASRKYEIYDHGKEDGLEGLVTVIGGKYTTSRQLGIDVMDKVQTILPQEINGSNQLLKRRNFLFGGETGEIEDYIKEELSHNHTGLSPDLLTYQIRNYGTRYKEVVGLGEGKPALLEQILAQEKEIWAQVHYAVQNEMALHLTDVVLRRTGLATVRNLNQTDAQRVAKEMAGLLGWDNEQIKKEIQQYLSQIEIK